MPKRLAKSAPVLVLGVATLFGLDGFLVYSGWRLATEPLDKPASHASRTLPEVGGVGFSAGTIPGQNQNEILARPLFTSTRRPYQPPAVELVLETPAVRLQIAPLDQVLAGVFIDAGHRRALLRGRDDTNSVWFNENDAVNGWRLISIEPDGATLEADGNRVQLELYPTASSLAQ